MVHISFCLWGRCQLQPRYFLHFLWTQNKCGLHSWFQPIKSWLLHGAGNWASLGFYVFGFRASSLWVCHYQLTIKQPNHTSFPHTRKINHPRPRKTKKRKVNHLTQKKFRRYYSSEFTSTIRKVV